MPRYFKVKGEVTGFSVKKVPTTVGGFSLEGTRIHNNWIPTIKRPEDRVCIENVRIRRCQHWANYAEGVIFRDIHVEDIRGGGRAPLFLRACLFDNVRISGWFGGVCFQWQYAHEATLDRAFLADNRARYKTIKLALDIASAKWTTFGSLIGVPAKLIKRDPTRQFVLTSESAATIVSRQGMGGWRIVAKDLLESGLKDTVVVPGQDARHSLLAQQLLDEGLLE